MRDQTITPIDLDDDDRLIGRILSRREVLALFGATGMAATIAACVPGSSASGTPAGTAAGTSATATATALATATATAAAVASAIPSCVVVPELTEGPYYLDTNLERADIRVETATGVAAEGATLEIGWVVSQVDGERARRSRA